MNIVPSLLFIDDFYWYFLSALLLFSVSVWCYTRLTPFHELSLIKAGNTAAAISLSGAMIGFALPLASVVANSVNLIDLLIFAVVSLVTQAIVFVVLSRMMPNISKDIENNQTAQATLLAVSSLCVGIINAAALVY